MPTHGEYKPGWGWYDSSTKQWKNDPAKITEIRLTPAADESARAQVDAWDRKNRNEFRRNPNYEQAIKLRDSDRSQDRDLYEKLTKGSRLRLDVGHYEMELAKAKEDGREIVD